MCNIIKIKPKPGKCICTISCIYNVLAFYGIEITEYEAYILVDGFQTSFNKGYMALNSFEGIDENLRCTGGFQTTWLREETNKQKVITNSIMNGIPVIVLIDSTNLNFDERLKKEYGFLRSFIIYGIDLEKNYFSVYDTFYLNENQEFEVIHFTVPIDYLVNKAKEFLIIYPDRKNLIQYDYKKILVGNVVQYLENKSSSGIYEHYGVAAVKYHISYIQEILAKNNEAEKLETCYYATNTFLFGTFMPMANYLLDFLKDYDLNNEDALINELKTLKKNWNILSNKVMKLTISKKENQSLQFLYNYKQVFHSTLVFLRKLVEILDDSILEGSIIC